MVGDGDTKNHLGALEAVLLLTLFEHGQRRETTDVVRQAPRQAAWHHKRHPTFADVLALVRKELWASANFCGLAADTETVRVPRVSMERSTDALSYAA